MQKQNEHEKMRSDSDFVKAEKLLASGDFKAAELLMRLSARKGNTFAKIELSRMYLRKTERWDGNRENLSKLTEFFSGKSGKWASAMVAICNNISDVDVANGLLQLKNLAGLGDGDAAYYYALCCKKPWAKALIGDHQK